MPDSIELRRLDHCSEPFGDLCAGRNRTIGQEQQELLAAHTAYHVVRARYLSHQPGDGAEGFIPGAMAIGVVDALEMVDVHGDRSEGFQGLLP
ncbi:hypothetical protein WR25_03391 [Diploscapter pachys]|uniref:Uncharacterized protein n=1 Tax=Diploscapter pachys TaxID=2018661 RepID=A0A2A2M2J0_9BILA|nr:hypothetical protein WR25_03391 [Diploscapter pachys]